jgi:hypothetical protein
MAPEDWQKLLSQHFVIQKRRRHWYFDLVFVLNAAKN